MRNGIHNHIRAESHHTRRIVPSANQRAPVVSVAYYCCQSLSNEYALQVIFDFRLKAGIGFCGSKVHSERCSWEKICPNMRALGQGGLLL